MSTIESQHLDFHPTATPETLSDLASTADLGPLDDKTALMLKYCESRVENKTLSTISDLQKKVASLEGRYIGVLRELRDKLQSIKFDDFLKIFIGVLGGLIVRAFAQDVLKAIQDIWVGIGILLFMFSLIFLVVRWVAPSARKRELDEEIRNFKGES